MAAVSCPGLFVMIEVRDVVKRFPGVTALDGISFRVERGQIVGFLGPNGAGKTTTMRLLTGYIPADSGTVTVAGENVFSRSLAVQRAVGYLPENVPLYPEMRVREYLFFRAKIKSIPRRKRVGRVGAMMEQCGVLDMAARPIGQLSKGYRQRVGLADALLHDPPILILDEPTIGLDPNQIRQVRKLIQDLGRRRTVILSTHILSEVEMICERFLIVNEGKIVEDGTLEDLRKGAKVTVVLDDPKDEMADVFKRVPGVSEVTRVEKGFVLDVGDSKQDDVERYVFQAAIDREWMITELKREAKTLEDLFVTKTMMDESK